MRFVGQAILVMTASLAAGLAIDEWPAQRSAQRVTFADSVTDLAGRRMPLRARDSVTFIVFVDATCAACRLHIRDAIRWATRQQETGAAVRIIMTNGAQAARQFGRLAGDSRAVAVAEPRVFQAMHVTKIPASSLIDHDGRLRQWWDGWPDAQIQDADRPLAREDVVHP
jgi:hypothetical protein